MNLTSRIAMGVFSIFIPARSFADVLLYKAPAITNPQYRDIKYAPVLCESAGESSSQIEKNIKALFNESCHMSYSAAQARGFVCKAPTVFLTASVELGGKFYGHAMCEPAPTPLNRNDVESTAVKLCAKSKKCIETLALAPLTKGQNDVFTINVGYVNENYSEPKQDYGMYFISTEGSQCLTSAGKDSYDGSYYFPKELAVNYSACKGLFPDGRIDFWQRQKLSE